MKEVNNVDFVALNGTGDEENNVDACCDTACEIPASQCFDSEAPDKSSSDCNLSSPRSFDVDYACDLRQGSDTDPNSHLTSSECSDTDSDLSSFECSDTDSDSDPSSFECSDTDSDYDPSSSECSNTDSDCETDNSDNWETSDNRNDVMMWSDPASVQKQHETNMRLHQQLFRLKKRRGKLEERITDLENTITGLTCPEMNLMKTIKKESSEGDPWSCFMMDQITNRLNKTKSGYRWSQEVIRQCIILQARSPGAYKCLRNSGMVNLPSTKTLRSYLASSTMDVGVTDIVKESMKAKIEELGGGNLVHVNIRL